MIQNTNDIYNLILRPEYTMPFIRGGMKPHGNYSVHNNTGNRIDITLGVGWLTIYMFHNMNSQYYEKISLSNAAGRAEYKRFRDLLLSKHIAAMVQDIEQNYR